MGLNDLVTFAQANFGRESPPPDGRWGAPPSWIPVDAVDALHGEGPAREESPDNERTALPQVQILDPRESLGVDEEGPDTPQDVSQSDSPEIQVYGTDAIAYYLPFHFYRSAWGVYVRESGLKFLAKVLKGEDRSTPQSVWVKLAYEVLYQHEMFHHLCELVSSLGEVAWLAEMYQTYFSDKAAAEHEEGMANAYAYRAGVNRSLRDVRTRLTEWMETQGPGYRDFAKHCTKQAFQRGELHISDRIFGGRVTLAADGQISNWPGQMLFDAVTSQRPRKILRDRTYLVMDCSPPWVSFFKPFPEFNGVQVRVYSRDHKPPHFHIFLPPDGPCLTRYIWPELEPYHGDYRLSQKQRRRLDQYLERHGGGIAKRIQQVPWQ